VGDEEKPTERDSKIPPLNFREGQKTAVAEINKLSLFIWIKLDNKHF